MNFLAVFLTAFAISFAFTPIAIKIAPKIGAVDVPKDGRRMHKKPMPRFGGLAIFMGTTVTMIVFLGESTQYKGIILGGIIIYLIGIIDDLKGMPAKVKLLGQIVCASVVFAFGVRISFVTDFLGLGQIGHLSPGNILCYFITVIWIVGITNTVNLIDGLDGLASGVSAIAALSIAYVAYIAYVASTGSVGTVYVAAVIAMLALAGAAIGFLPFNFHPAKIFMGDGGSLFLGFMLATVSTVGSVKSSTFVAVIVPVLILGVPIFDTAFAILRRIKNRRPIMEADKGHLHHRLIASGIGQRRSVLLLYGICGIMGVAAMLLARDLFVETFCLIIIAATYIYIFITDLNRSSGVPLRGVDTRLVENSEVSLLKSKTEEEKRARTELSSKKSENPIKELSDSGEEYREKPVTIDEEVNTPRQAASEPRPVDEKADCWITVEEMIKK